ncbi:MAG: hypothetical protein CME63_08740 [Halobacteriovoraceae bacterium]|nr:hypothetical protein [Halobacteriovoraceae bacterium]|tara:strand:- start:4941 stop:6113 length:1173 start_codon:yes stop_codon:yes gene_type:complete
MILPLLKKSPLPFSLSIPSLDYGIIRNESIYVGRACKCTLGTHDCTCTDKLGPYRSSYRWPKKRQRKGQSNKRPETLPKALPLKNHSSFALVFLVLSAFIILAMPITATAQVTKSVTDNTRPLWEGGLALVSARVPAYPGANQYNFFTLPFPSFFYRGTYVRADEEGGMRGRFFKSKKFEINLSIGGSLPASSEDNQAREGMPDLDTMAELGPGLLATLWESKGDSSFKLGLNIPLRSAISLDFWEIKERGLVFNPLLYFITEDFLAPKVFSFTGLSTVIASQKFHRVFYQVDAPYVTDTRAQYQAHGGYLSTTLSQGFSRQLFKDVMGFIGVSYSHYKGSANYNSPLMKQDYNFNMALGLVWWFYESEEKENHKKIHITRNQNFFKGSL